MIKITRRALGVLVIKPAKGGAQLSVNASGNPAQIKVRLDIARQGPPGDGMGVVFKQKKISALAAGQQEIELGSQPMANGFFQVFINGILHLDVGDFSISGSVLTVASSADVYSGDQILVIFQ